MTLDLATTEPSSPKPLQPAIALNLKSSPEPEPEQTKTSFFKSKLFFILLSVGFAVAAVIGGVGFYLSRDSDPSQISTSPTNSSSPSSVKVIKSVHKDFAQEAATFFKEPTAANFKAAVSLFPKWQYYVHTIVSVSVVLLLVVGLAVGLSVYFGTLKKSSSLLGEAENGNGTTNLVITEPEKSWVEKNVITFSVLCVVGVIVIAGGIGAFIKREDIKKLSCSKPESLVVPEHKPKDIKVGDNVFKPKEGPETEPKKGSEVKEANDATKLEEVKVLTAPGGEAGQVEDFTKVDRHTPVDPTHGYYLNGYHNPNLIDTFNPRHLAPLFKLIWMEVREGKDQVDSLFASENLFSMPFSSGVNVQVIMGEPIEQTNLRIMFNCKDLTSLKLVYIENSDTVVEGGVRRVFIPSSDPDPNIDNELVERRRLAKKMLEHMYKTKFIEK
jgi:hypothetical protein